MERSVGSQCLAECRNYDHGYNHHPHSCLSPRLFPDRVHIFKSGSDFRGHSSKPVFGSIQECLTKNEQLWPERELEAWLGSHRNSNPWAEADPATNSARSPRAFQAAGTTSPPVPPVLKLGLGAQESLRSGHEIDLACFHSEMTVSKVQVVGDVGDDTGRWGRRAAKLRAQTSGSVPSPSISCRRLAC